MDLKNHIKEMIEKIGIDKEKREKIVIIFLLGVFLLLIATPISDYSKKNRNSKQDTDGKDNNTIISKPDSKKSSNDAYISYLENKLEQMIRGMDGAGRVSVMITLKDGGEKILDKNRPYESATETGKEEGKETSSEKIRSDQETVLVSNEGNTEPIIVKEQYPDVCGVVVLCEGGDDKALSVKIKEICEALFSLEPHKIVVGKLTSGYSK